MEIQIVNRLFLIIASYVSTVQSRFSDNFGLWKNLMSLNRDCTVLSSHFYESLNLQRR